MVGVRDVAAPFSAAASPVNVAGGQVVELVLDFAPSSIGPFDGRLTLTDSTGRSVAVQLRGTGIPVPECGDPPTCWATSFDFDAGVCRSARRADGTSCTSSFACFARAECLGGTCVGTLTTCDDRNPCTVDACGEDGCLHLEGSVECPVPDPCQAAFCDPAAGCSTQPLPDGTLCGAATCRTARVCIDGRCVDRPQPNAGDECTGVAIAAAGDSTCVLTRAGSVRCWGAGFGQPYRVGFGTLTAGQAKVALVDRATSLSMSASACMSLAAGGLQCVGRSQFVHDAGAGVHVSSVGNIGVGYGAITCWTLLNGSVECEAQPAALGARSPFDGGIVSLAAQPASFCAVRDDGGVVCWSGVTAADVQGLPAPARALRLGSDLSCAVLDQGVACWLGGTVYSLPPQLTDIAVPYTSGQRPYYSAGPLEDGGTVECVLDFSDAGFACWPMFDAGVLPAVRAVAIGSRHRCVLTTAGDVACAGENRSAQLGDPSVAPPGTHRVLIGEARLVDVGHYGVAVAVLLDGGVSSWGNAVATSGLPGASAIDLATDGVGACVLSANGAVVCSGPGGTGAIAGLPPIATFVRGPRATSGFLALTDGGSQCSFPADGAQVTCAPTAGARQQVAGDDVLCSVLFDAGVVCEGNNRYGQLGTGSTAPISGRVAIQGLRPARKVAATLSTACALELDGRALCWGRGEDGGVFAPTAVPGVLPFGRDLACGHGHCCLLVGDNAVSCWGDNLLNQLGREGRSSQQPVAVPMPSRVEQLAAGGYTTCARLRTGAVWCWGDNARGQLGFAPLLRSEAPVWVLH